MPELREIAGKMSVFKQRKGAKFCGLLRCARNDSLGVIARSRKRPWRSTKLSSFTLFGYLLIPLLLFSVSQVWSQRAESLQGLDLRVEQGQQVAFELMPEVFEQVTDYLENHPVIARFFIEDNMTGRHYGTITDMGIMTELKRVIFNGTLDQPLQLTDQGMKVYLSIK
jgi:hypothetical protein